MSNPTELPDLEAVAEMLESQHAWLTNVAAANLVRKMARRAQPEGEAPQAEPVAYITSDKRMLVFADRVTGNDHGMTPLYATATLSPLCGAQHAESGKEGGSIEDYNEFNRLLDELEGAKVDAHACGNDFGTGNKHQVAYENLVAYIDKWSARRAPGTPEAPKPPFPISDDEMAALRRFWECATDGEGYDVEKSMMQRLAEMGLVQRKSGAYYMATDFGLYLLGEYTIQRAAQLDGGQEGSESNG